jgi:chorismate mutase
MLESHITPDQAWSDAKQQITPEELGELLGNLIIRDIESTDKSFSESLDTLRTKINGIDDQLVKLIATRMGIAEEIGVYKKAHNITILQPERWEEIKRLQFTAAEKEDLSHKFILKYLEAIHQESIRHQTSIMNKK